MHDGIEQRLAHEAAPGEHPGEENRGWQTEHDAAQSDAQAQSERLDFPRGVNQIRGCMLEPQYTGDAARLHRARGVSRGTDEDFYMAYYRAVAQAAASSPERIGVLLVNLGTPDSPTYFAVQRYLREFLSDRRVINTARRCGCRSCTALCCRSGRCDRAATTARSGCRTARPLAVYSHRLDQ